jgi:sugar phosphate isomerase/epimerase
MKIGVCTAPENIVGNVPGLEFIEPGIANLLCPRENEDAFSRRLAALKACPLPAPAVNMLFPADLKTTGPAVDNDAVDAHVEIVLDRARRAGVEFIVYGSGGSRMAPDGFDFSAARSQIVDHMKRWAPMFHRCGLVLALEPLHRAECNIVTTVTEGAELVRRVNHPSVRLLADTYHMACDGEGPQSIRDAGELIVHVHCAEGKGRVPVGFGEEDHRPYFRALKDIGYDGLVSIEARWKNFAEELPRAVALLRRQIDEA